MYVFRHPTPVKKENVLVPGRLPCALRGLPILTPIPGTTNLISSLQLRPAWASIPGPWDRTVYFISYLAAFASSTPPPTSEISLRRCRGLRSVART